MRSRVIRDSKTAETAPTLTVSPTAWQAFTETR
ncbi:DUF397 domain-containing protein [Streptomyces sp. NBC_00847]